MNFLQNRALYIIFSFNIFLSSFLLFMVQPMITKSMLPHLGGTPSLWQLSVAIYQFILLAGYLYAHLISKFLTIKKQVVIHLALIGFSLLFVPVSLKYMDTIAVSNHPFLWTIVALILSISLPFFVLSTNSILMQNWFIGNVKGKLKNPYFLYIISNIGSLVSLLAYPFIFERYSSLSFQFGFWSHLFLVFLVSLGVCLYVSRKYYDKNNIQNITIDDEIDAADHMTIGDNYDRKNPSFLVKCKWVLIAFTVSSLMLGVTSFIAQDIGGVPMFWVLPLALYLLSFIIAFSTRIKFYQSALNIQVITTAFLCVSLTKSIDFGFEEMMILNLIAFFTIALTCHKRLFNIRPNPSHLTEYYLFISVGGVLGGVFNGFLAPMIFNSNSEYVLIILLATLLRPLQKSMSHPKKEYRAWGLAALTIFFFVGLYDHLFADTLYFITILLLFIAPFIGSSYLYPGRFTIIIATILLANHTFSDQGNILYKTRNFFGDKQVVAGKVNDEAYSLLKHGPIIHGIQYVGKRKFEIEGYFKPLIEMHKITNKHVNHPIAAIGLGAGNIACLGDSEQQIDFYEIDPQIIEIAQNPTYFSYLSDCPSQKKVILGDGRIELAKAENGKYGLIVIDAFNSDSVPSHLLTKEAFEIYLNKLAPGGIIAFDISTDYMNFAPVIKAVSDSLNVVARYRVVHDDLEAFSSEWMIVTKKIENIADLPLLNDEIINKTDKKNLHKYWYEVEISDENKDKYRWTDDKYFILDALR